ncbi:transposase [Cesiribacter sp. SM1]|uniref:transposase n=1 Tax=Cesiribacter sp. SM1 TaxID=2861196 RepID=UPI00351CB97F
MCHNRRIHSNRVFDAHARRGISSMSWCYGFKAYLIINQVGEIINRSCGPLCFYHWQCGQQ